jgi:aspartyl-tRNA(Asn)/glutamyl-tRNA(Gln) amidotransferase subunit A
MNLFNDTIQSLTERLSNREITARLVTEFSLDAAERLNKTLNAFLQIDRAGATARAEELDSTDWSTRPRPALAGIPIAIKDNICTRGMQTSCGSRILGNYHPPYDATAIERLKEAGAIILGKVNCDEFAMGSSNENSAFGPVRNPWDTERVPGGSSGGSAAVVSAGIVPVSLGSDTGGSVRQPAAMCGIIGLKPTYGRISRYGLVAFGSSLDQIGVFGKKVEDVATVLKVIAGRDPKDSTSADVPVPDYTSELKQGIDGLRLGVPRLLFGEGLNKEVRSSVEQAIEAYRKLGVEIVDIELPHTKYSIAVYYIIAMAEASSNLARYDGVRYGFRAEEAKSLRDMYRVTRDEGFGSEVKRRIMIGTFVLSSGYYDAYYRKAQQARALLKEDFKRAFERCDAVITPTAPSPAFLIGEKTNDPLSMYLEDIYTVTSNLVGIPGISIPCGLSSNGLPIGMQLVAPYWKESTLFRLAHAYEQEHPFTAEPKLHA